MRGTIADRILLPPPAWTQATIIAMRRCKSSPAALSRLDFASPEAGLLICV
jgi:hypothetical protein